MLRSISFQGSIMVNICDSEVMGKSLREGELKIDIHDGYFGGELVDRSTALQSLKKCEIANLVGEEIVRIAISEKLADPRAVRLIDGVPFLMIYKFQA